MRHIQGNFNFIQAYTLPKVLSDKVGFVVLELSKAFESFMEKRLHGIQLGMKEFNVLVAVSEIGPISQQRLSQLLQIDRTTMVFVLDELEKLKLVERKANPEDRRAHAVVITGAGKTLLKKAMVILEDVQEEFFSSLTKSEMTSLQNILFKLFVKSQELDT